MYSNSIMRAVWEQCHCTAKSVLDHCPGALHSQTRQLSDTKQKSDSLVNIREHHFKSPYVALAWNYCKRSHQCFGAYAKIGNW
ncbi:hypothetical protein NPIL_702551 [Nephila pilipes]|uniref:Uncharacterized protein n=1 Tax=Nephila pilipes TaxID=299642 RepID=A0A8X6MXG4_NEPPI|nr:hypothetical protein NPIL_370451 [Nephila pilipes]GFS87904.1 hypothetical protein NPIL_702551 [Nephila pilipes]